MDLALLIDVCVAIATGLCAGLLVFGAWLCLPDFGGTRSKGREHEGESTSEAVVRGPRPRIKAGARSG